uniref:Uncharacterized protein n=1 Tax=Cyprinodon variegatus TaxID=28743 RepID=A0A3Q2FVZ6_CYPVA
MQSPGQSRDSGTAGRATYQRTSLVTTIPSAWRVFGSLRARSQTYPFRLFIRENTTLSTRCEVAVDLEGVPRAALVRINPVFTCRHKEQWKTIRGQAEHLWVDDVTRRTLL